MQRLFLALGVHAERGLPIRTGRVGGPVFTATDVDVLAVSYAPNFHRSVFHAECKSGHAAKAFDRIFWIAGVRRLLEADRSLLVISTYDLQSAEFARTLDVETLHLDTVRGMEQAYQIPREWWPGRTNMPLWDPLLKGWGPYASLPGMSEQLYDTLRKLFMLSTEEGWRVFSYTLLDQLLLLLGEIPHDLGDAAEHNESLHSVRLAVSCALVRLSHFMLGICRDLVARQPAERVQCLADRLTFGDQEPDVVRQVVERSAALLRSALAADHPGLQAIQADQLLRTPEYQPLLLKLVQRLMRHPERAIYLPYAAEMIQFGYAPEPRGAVEAWVQAGLPALNDLKQFLANALGVPATFLAPPGPRVLSDALARVHAERATMAAAQPRHASPSLAA